MKKFTKIAVALAVALGLPTVASAQEEVKEKEYKPYPYMFVGLQGGVQNTFTNYGIDKIYTPTASVAFGSYFTPSVGARLHVNGIWNKGGFGGLNEEYEYKYVTTDVDLLFNLTNFFSKKEDHFFNVVLVAGVGLNYAWDNDELLDLQRAGKVSTPFAWEDHRFSCNARVGMQFDMRVSKHIGVNLEVAANRLADRYNSKYSNSGDWQATAQLGLTYKFGFKKKPVVLPPPPPAEVWATRIDTTWYDEVTYVDVPSKDTLSSNIYYKIRMSEPEPAAKVQEIVDFVKSHKNCKISVVGYADKGTGNSRVNMKYSKQRAEKVVKALVDAGVDAALITSEAKGDKVQPFAENDQNRVVITVTTGDGVKKEKVVTKKFRTEEVRYRVE